MAHTQAALHAVVRMASRGRNTPSTRCMPSYRYTLVRKMLDPRLDRNLRLHPSTLKDIEDIVKTRSYESAQMNTITVLVNSFVSIATAAGTAKYVSDNTNELEEKKAKLEAQEYRKELQAELLLVKARVDELEALSRQTLGQRFSKWWSSW